MVATAGTGGGGLFDSNLRSAYSRLAPWLVEALQVIGEAGADGDPVLAQLQRLDWDKTSVEDTVAPIGKIQSAIGTAVDDLKRLLRRADNAWDGEVFSVFRVIVSGLQDDCELVRHTLEQMRTDVDGDKKGIIPKNSAFDVLDKLTADIDGEADKINTYYGWIADATKKELSKPGDRDTVIAAFQELKSAVDSRVDQLTELPDCTKRHLGALHFRSGSPGKP